MAKFALLAALILSPLGLCAPAPGYPFTASLQNDTGVAAPAPAPASMTRRSDETMPSHYGEACIAWTERREGGDMRATFQCTSIPVGLAIQGYMKPGVDLVGSTTEWFDQPGTYVSQWQTFTPEDKGPDPYLRYDLRPNTPAFDCTANLDRDSKPWYQRDSFQASIICNKLPDFAKARAKLGMVAQVDEYSKWIDGPVTSFQYANTGYHTPTDLVKDPHAELQFNFSH